MKAFNLGGVAAATQPTGAWDGFMGGVMSALPGSEFYVPADDFFERAALYTGTMLSFGTIAIFANDWLRRKTRKKYWGLLGRVSTV